MIYFISKETVCIIYLIHFYTSSDMSIYINGVVNGACVLPKFYIFVVMQISISL